MKCPKCGSKYITVINQPVQLKEKTESSAFIYITLIAVIVLTLGIILIIAGRANSKNNAYNDAILSEQASIEKEITISPFASTTPINTTTTIVSISMEAVGSFLLNYSSAALIAIGVLHALRPHKMENRLIGVCMDCGHTAALKEFKRKTEENTEPVSEEESKQE